MKGLDYSIWEALKNRDFQYLLYVPDEFYYDHIHWRIHHYLLRERCEFCRNWHFAGKWEGRPWGICDMDEYYTDFHGHCGCWNLEPKDDGIHTRDEDGFEKVGVTPLGKVITQVARGGVWQYKHDGEPDWY
jgi:hypothetical protein